VLLPEDNALLMGTALLFLALGVTMLATRQINWYKIGLSTTKLGILSSRAGI
jgi:inner membrane protein